MWYPGRPESNHENADADQMQILLDAERLKVNYIIDKLGVDNKNAKRSERMLEKQSEQLKIAQENKTTAPKITLAQLGFYACVAMPVYLYPLP